MGVRELEKKIRDFINDPRRQRNLIDRPDGTWHQICSALDVIGDTELAINSYLREPPGRNEGHLYIVVYGIMQVLFVQQDATRSLLEALNVKYSPDSALKEIRSIRNSSIGHPTDKTEKEDARSFHFISRPTLSPKGFQLLSNYSDRTPTEFSKIDISELIEAQRGEIVSALTAVAEELKEEEMAHREEFRNDELADAFPNVMGYYFEKVGESVWGAMDGSFGATHVELIDDILDDFEEKLEERGIRDAYPSIENKIDLLNYALPRLRELMEEGDFSGERENEAYVYLFFIREHIEALERYATEIDESYEEDI